MPCPMRFRTLRMSFSLAVQPLLLLKVLPTPSNTDLYSYSLRLDLEVDKVGHVCGGGGRGESCMGGESCVHGWLSHAWVVSHVCMGG